MIRKNPVRIQKPKYILLRQTRYIQKDWEHFTREMCLGSKISGHFGFMPHKLLHNFGGMVSHYNPKCMTSHSLPLRAAAVCYFLITAADNLQGDDDWRPLHMFLSWRKVRVNISSSSQEKCGHCYHLLHNKSHCPGIKEETLAIRESGCINLEFCSSWGAS